MDGDSVVKLSELSDLVLISYYELYKTGFYDDTHNRNPRLELDGIATEYQSQKAIDLLLSKRLLTKSGQFADPELSGKGIDYIERCLEDEESFISIALQSYTPFAEEKVASSISFNITGTEQTLETRRTSFGLTLIDNSKPLNVPGSDRFVSISDNQRHELFEVIDNVVDAVRGDNEYGDRDPEDKEQRLAEISAGRKLFEAARVSISTVDAVLIKTLVYLSGIGVAVSQIADAIMKIQTLLGL